MYGKSGILNNIFVIGRLACCLRTLDFFVDENIG